ncbi:MAG TPA: glycerol kinase GlpK [Dehalococcoidales bacterium]|nr:glycerol kinase GlpK [Dehalococcoidales bacterium]
MSDKQYILAIDEGTTGCTSVLIDKAGRIAAKTTDEIKQIFPQPGWVEQDPLDIFNTALNTARKVVHLAQADFSQVKGLGITNQRETTLVWDRRSGLPVYNALVWQCRRTAPLCEELKKRGLKELVKDKTGLLIDAYFSATKLRWILDNIPDGQKRAENGELLFGTVDSWLVWKLTGGLHITDFSNACRTMLFNIHTLQWDPELLEILNIPARLLPAVCPSGCIYGNTRPGWLGEKGIPIGSVIGDQQAALFGQACYETGDAKNTYGTGSFLLFNTGLKAIKSEKGLVTTIAWGLQDKIYYALEGSIFVTGAAVQWLRDGLKIISNAAESETLARAVPDTGGVYFVPAFAGLGAPHWDMYARGTVLGLTRGTTRQHIVRATLESIAYQVRDVAEAFQAETGQSIRQLRVDGGGSANRFLMQFQSDILNIPIQVAAVNESTAMGAGHLAGLAGGFWTDKSELGRLWQASETFEPGMTADQRQYLYRRWQKAVRHAAGWAEEER